MVWRPKCYVSPSVDLSALIPNFRRADLEFMEVDHSGASFEARVFIDNPTANQDTPKIPQAGYATSFYIFGHGGCFGDVGHCDIHERRLYDPRPTHQLTPARRAADNLTADNFLRSARHVQVP